MSLHDYYSNEKAVAFNNAVVKFESDDNDLKGEMTRTIQIYSLTGGAIMALPLWGFETLFYIIVLWRMYVKLCKIANVPFWKNFFKSILGGLAVNIFINFVCNIFLDYIPLVGWVAAAILGYVSMLASGYLYLRILKLLHKKGRVKGVD